MKKTRKTCNMRNKTLEQSNTQKRHPEVTANRKNHLAFATIQECFKTSSSERRSDGSFLSNYRVGERGGQEVEKRCTITDN